VNIYNETLIGNQVRPFRICTDYLIATPPSGDFFTTSFPVPKISYNSEMMLVREKFSINLV